MNAIPPVIRRPGRVDYLPTFEAMQNFTARRDPDTPDEFWLLEHPPVFTLGLAGKPEHLLRASDIPVIKVDRGGQITYHGPGQVIVYLLLDLRRRRLGVRELVERVEQAVIDLLQAEGISAQRREGAPGVYAGDAKVAALGLRVKGGCCYHGVSLNVDMNLEPFRDINPCGYAGMAVTSLRELGVPLDLAAAGEGLLTRLLQQLTEN